MQGRALPMLRIGRPMLPAQAQMQLELCRQLQEGHCPLVASQRISWLQVTIYAAWQNLFSDTSAPCTLAYHPWTLHALVLFRGYPASSQGLQV